MEVSAGKQHDQSEDGSPEGHTSPLLMFHLSKQVIWPNEWGGNMCFEQYMII